MKLTESDLSKSTTLFEVTSEKYFSIAQLTEWLPDVKTALWFGKVFKLNYEKMSELMWTLFKSDVMNALMKGNHSLALQDYVVGMVPTEVWSAPAKDIDFVDEPPPGEVLPEIWEAAMIEIAETILKVTEKLDKTLHLLPSKEGRMFFQSLATMNRMRPTIGAYQATIKHDPVPDVAVVLDVSGSMTEQTIRGIIDDVVALSWKANAHMVIVSDHAYHWEPGAFGTKDILAKAEYNGTHYETLAPLFDRDWGTVVTIADYDSSPSAFSYLSRTCKGRIGTVLDISLVGRPTFLGKCLGQFAEKLEPQLIGRNIINW